MAIAANPGDGIRLTLFTRGGAVVAQVKLSWRRAALLGSDLITLAVQQEMRLERKETPPEMSSGGQPPASQAPAFK